MLDFGLADVGATVCARVLGALRELYLVNVLAGTDRVIVWEALPDTGGNKILTAQTTFRWTPTFPYTYPVAPDVPV